MPQKCAHDESRLTCVDCGKIICSACLVQCPVGFRCKGCGTAPKVTGGNSKPRSGSLTHRDAMPSPPVVIAALAAAGAAGYAFGFLLPHIQIPYISVIIAFIVGMIFGRLLHPLINHDKLGHRATITAVFGLLIGMSFTRIALMLQALSIALALTFSSHPDQIFNALTAIVSFLFDPVGFILGFLRSTTWKM